jgi:hypothetical protein
MLLVEASQAKEIANPPLGVLGIQRKRARQKVFGSGKVFLVGGERDELSRVFGEERRPRGTIHDATRSILPLPQGTVQWLGHLRIALFFQSSQGRSSVPAFDAEERRPSSSLKNSIGPSSCAACSCRRAFISV